MWKSFKNYIGLLIAYTQINLNSQLEYRGAFISEAIGMLINDCFWVGFWLIFFRRFPVLQGWNAKDIVTLWAISAAGFGVAYAVMGNSWYLPGLIVNGQLDLWMLQPRAVLPHLLVGRTLVTAWGDAVFGYLVYLGFVRPDLHHAALFVLLSLSVAMAFVGLGVLTASLTFYLGNGTLLAEQWRFAAITFSTYPESLFTGAVKLLLFTAIPAGFISYIPVRALRNLSLMDAGLAAMGSIGIMAAGAAAFYLGLRRYESGNLISMNG